MPPPRLRGPHPPGGPPIPDDLDLFEDDGATRGSKSDLRGVLQIVKRRYKVALITFLLLLGPALVPGLLADPVYVGEAKVAIERTPEIMVFGSDFMPRLGTDANRGGPSVEMVVMKSDRNPVSLTGKMTLPENTSCL